MYEIKNATGIGANELLYTTPLTLKESKWDICTLATDTVRNNVLNITLIYIAALVYKLF